MSTPVSLTKVYGTDPHGRHYCLGVFDDALGRTARCDDNPNPQQCPHYRTAIAYGDAVAARLLGASPASVRVAQANLTEMFNGCCAPTFTAAWSHAFGAPKAKRAPTLVGTLAAAIDGWASTMSVALSATQAYSLAIVIADELGA